MVGSHRKPAFTQCNVAYAALISSDIPNLVVVSHQLDDDPNILVKVLDRDDSHDVSGVLGIRISAAGVGEDQTGVRLR
jgi:hypothetical protein